MESYWKGLLAGVSVLALGLAAYQTVRTQRLERRLGAHIAAVRGAEGRRGPGADTEALARRVAALERTATRLLSLILSGNRRTGPAPAGRGSEADDLEARLKGLRADVDAVLSGDALSTEEGRKRLHDLVEKAQRKARQKARDRWRELFEHRMRSALKDFADKEGLSADQLQQLTRIAYEAIDKSMGLNQAYQKGEITPAEFLEKNKNVQEEMNRKVRGLLGEEAFRKFDAARKKFLGR